ncbi:hypothetical protein G1H11_07055 [Phytoactinopolyspora alkaliphila]|uniref:Uncharacterized protein n=1 Tax=Phytoactinopolyspora alkaliphila TaxID=1783498 RepID=A0A6N9YJL7_9ACTN|nr:hypothetical protein [Phytoactinopolyspora alkaliphila]NED95069.1 hypothetical protein [Phytoactinopolyspora alkaliphila]
MYERPQLYVIGSVVEHTLSRCNPNLSGPPPKDSADVPHHIDQHGECSATGDNGGGFS